MTDKPRPISILYRCTFYAKRNNKTLFCILVNLDLSMCDVNPSRREMGHVWLFRMHPCRSIIRYTFTGHKHMRLLCRKSHSIHFDRNRSDRRLRVRFLLPETTDFFLFFSSDWSFIGFRCFTCDRFSISIKLLTVFSVNAVYSRVHICNKLTSTVTNKF